jgi:hypothetical protein
MTRASLSAVFLFAASLSGCDGPKPILPPPPPHGGTAFPLPQGKGFVEVVRQNVPDQPKLTQLVIYFLDDQCKPLPSVSTVASFLPRGRRAASVALKTSGDADPLKSGALSSAPFGDPGEIAGVISATIESKAVSIPISIR